MNPVNMTFLLQLISQPSNKNAEIQPFMSRYSRMFADPSCTLNVYDPAICADGTSLNDRLHSGAQKESRTKRNSLKCKKRLWSEGIVPFIIAPDLNPEIQAKLDRAVDIIERVSCVRFVDQTYPEGARVRSRRAIPGGVWGTLGFVLVIKVFLGPVLLHYPSIFLNAQSHASFTITCSKLSKYLEVREGSAGVCRSTIGRSSRTPTISLSQTCSAGQILHELMHTLGFLHEHTRPDRDDYIRVLCDNIEPGLENNFRKLKESVVEQFGEPYDFYSIMHYRLDHFSHNGRPTLELATSQQLDLSQIGRMEELSSIDIRKLNKLYGCRRQDTPSNAIL